jgi:hypothetical protein
MKVLGAMTLVWLALTSPAMGAGGQNPGLPGKLTGPAVSGVLVIDPHEIPLTPDAKLGTLRLQKGTRTASAIFAVDPVTVPYTCGCDVQLTNTRFVGKLLASLIGPQLVIQMFKTLGMIPPNGDLTALPGQPMITSLSSAVCTGSRDDAGSLITIPNTLPASTGTCQVTQAQGSTLGFGTFPIAGTLSFDVVVQFFVAQ